MAAHTKLKGEEKTFEEERIPKWKRIDVFSF
jgi:hypothetical protein